MPRYFDYILLKSITVSDHTFCNGNHSKYYFHNDLRSKQEILPHLKFYIRYCQHLFQTVWCLLNHCLPQFFAILLKINWVFKILLLLWIFIRLEIIYTTSLKIGSTFSFSQHFCWLHFWVMFLINKTRHFKQINFILIFIRFKFKFWNTPFLRRSKL